VTYQIRITEKILKKIAKPPRKEKERLVQSIDSLAEEPRPKGCKKLKRNRTPSCYRIRSGNYQVVYSIQDEVLLILVVEVGHRKDVYQ